MREALFILFVIALLLGMTAIRYRKQIAGMIGLAKMLKEAKDGITAGTKNLPRDDGRSIPLVNCSKCGVWVPQTKAIRVRDICYCSEACLAATAS